MVDIIFFYYTIDLVSIILIPNDTRQRLTMLDKD